MSTDAVKQHVTLSEKSDHLSVLDAIHTQLFRVCKSMLLFTAGNSVIYLFFSYKQATTINKSFLLKVSFHSTQKI